MLSENVSLEDQINSLFDAGTPKRSDETLALLRQFRSGLNKGMIRAAEPIEDGWQVNPWVKKGIFLHAALGTLAKTSSDNCSFELDTFPRRSFALEENVRMAGEGCVIRDGSYLAPMVTCMPPVFVNMGSFIGSGTIIDSHAMIGFCTQIGERVHVGPGVQVGGVINPPERLPTILADDVLIGGNSGIYDGVIIGQGAILAAGTILTGQTRVYDTVKDQTYRRNASHPLIIPPMAIVVPGVRTLRKSSMLASGIMIQMPVIIGYRNEPGISDDDLSELVD